MQVYIWKEQCFTSHFSWCYYTNLNMTCAITGLKLLLWTWFPGYCRLIEIFELTNTGNRKASISKFVRQMKSESKPIKFSCIVCWIIETIFTSMFKLLKARVKLIPGLDTTSWSAKIISTYPALHWLQCHPSILKLSSILLDHKLRIPSNDKPIKETYC